MASHDADDVYLPSEHDQSRVHHHHETVDKPEHCALCRRVVGEESEEEIGGGSECGRL